MKMDVILAGHNIDHDIILEFQRLQPERQDLTPETVAAAYARISRNPRPVNELRAIARGEVEKARASNRNIVFEMGHSSIAEHAVFNLDLLGVSRLLVEEIERFRLASYTEKSQRYVLLADDFVIPQEIREAGLEEGFTAAIRLQNGFYHKLYEKLLPYVLERNPELAADPANRSLLEGWAKEDARYCLSLATETQLGMTANARNIELMIRRLAASPLAEAREYSRRLYDAVKGVAPSLVRYTEPTPYDRETREAIRSQADEIVSKMTAFSPGGAQGEGTAPALAGAGTADDLVRLLDATPAADDKIAAALLHGASHLPLAGCLEIAAHMEIEEKEDADPNRPPADEGLRRRPACIRARRADVRAGHQRDLLRTGETPPDGHDHRPGLRPGARRHDPALHRGGRNGGPLPGDLRPDRGDLGDDPPDRARSGRLHPDERTPASGHDSGQRPRALPPRPRPGGRPRPMGYPGVGRADGEAGPEGDADHADARGGKGRL